MKIELTKSEMLALWREARGMEICGENSPVTERVDGAYIDSMLTWQMQGWYADLLAHGPEEMLACTDLAVAMEPCGDFCWEGTVPATTVRVFGVTVDGYPLPCRMIENITPNPYMEPVVVPKGNKFVLMPFEEKPELVRIRVVMRPTDGKYVFDDSALKELFPYQPKEL